jgi:hypothetical protein
MSKTRDNSQAVAAFVAARARSTPFSRFVRLSTEHFNLEPGEITWADVGTVGSYLEGLRRVSDAAFREGEHAT